MHAAKCIVLSALFVPLSVLGATIGLGLVSFDPIVPGAPGSPGVNGFNIVNLTGDPVSGGSALPPDFPIFSPVTLFSVQLSLIVDGVPSVVLIGDIGPGSLVPPSALLFPDTSQITSATLTAILSTTTLALSGGDTFTTNSQALTATLLPSVGPFLTAGSDLVVVEISDETVVPESVSPILMASLFAVIAWRRRKGAR